MPVYKKVTRTGVVLEQEVFYIAPQTKNLRDAKPKVSLKTREEKDEYNRQQSLRRFIRSFNNNFNADCYYATLTVDDENYVDTFPDNKRIQDNYIRCLQRINPDVKLIAVMGRGKNTSRIHFHMIISGVSRRDISEKWKYGKIKNIEHLREHNYYKSLSHGGKKVDHGADYTGLATYLFNHWTPEQGNGKRWRQTNNLTPPDADTPKLTKRVYSDTKPPITPKGYMLVDSKVTDYGYLYFKYVRIPHTQSFTRRN